MEQQGSRIGSLENAKLIYDLLVKQLGALMETCDKLDAKASFGLAGQGVVLAAMLSIVSSLKRTPSGFWEMGSLVVAFGAALVGLVFSILALWPRNVYTYPVEIRTWTEYGSVDHKELIGMLIIDLHNSCERDKTILKSKALRVVTGACALVVSGISAAFFIVYRIIP